MARGQRVMVTVLAFLSLPILQEVNPDAGGGRKLSEFSKEERVKAVLILDSFAFLITNFPKNTNEVR